MQLTCRTCQSSIPPEDINIDRLVAKCTQCGAVFSFADRLEAPPAPARTRPEIAPPKGITITEDPYHVTIVRRWFSPMAFGLLFFVIFWDGFLIFWYAMALGPARPSGAMALMPILFPLLHVAVGLFLTYWLLCLFFNRTTIQVNEQELSIRHHPLPWPGSRALNPVDIDQLFCKERVSRSKNGTSRSYQLHARVRDGKKHKLLDNLDDQDHALFLEQRLEKLLGIQDRRVAGEMSR